MDWVAELLLDTLRLRPLGHLPLRAGYCSSDGLVEFLPLDLICRPDERTKLIAEGERSPTPHQPSGSLHRAGQPFAPISLAVLTISLSRTWGRRRAIRSTSQT